VSIAKQTSTLDVDLIVENLKTHDAETPQALLNAIGHQMATPQLFGCERLPAFLDHSPHLSLNIPVDFHRQGS